MEKTNKIKRTPFGLDERRKLTEFLHLSIVEKIAHSKPWVCENIVFQGGTSLHLAWNSPRFSEDVDFLTNIEKEKELVQAVKFAAKKVHADVSLKYGGSIELKGKKGPGNQMMVFHFCYSHPEKRGKILVKSEFMQTNPEKFNEYKTQIAELKSAHIDVFINPIVPVSTLKSVYADKIVAIVNRPYVKVRDYFDLWWLREATGAKLQKHENWKTLFLNSLETNFKIYNIIPEEFSNNLKILSEKFEDPGVKEQFINDVERDINDWLPGPYYAMLKSMNAFEQIVEFTHKEMNSVSETLEEEYVYSTPCM